MNGMVLSRDEIETYLPENPKLVILGTMGAISARTLDGIRPADAFFYHNPRNQFWSVLQLVFDPTKKPSTLSVQEKKAFLKTQRIAMANIVQDMRVAKNEAQDPSDDVLFRAHANKRLNLKKVSDEFAFVLKTVPTFFTCRAKPPLHRLLIDYFELNGIDLERLQKIGFLPTPTRCSPVARSQVWRKEMGLEPSA